MAPSDFNQSDVGPLVLSPKHPAVRHFLKKISKGFLGFVDYFPSAQLAGREVTTGSRILRHLRTIVATRRRRRE